MVKTMSPSDTLTKPTYQVAEDVTSGRIWVSTNGFSLVQDASGNWKESAPSAYELKDDYTVVVDETRSQRLVVAALAAAGKPVPDDHRQITIDLPRHTRPPGKSIPIISP